MSTDTPNASWHPAFMPTDATHQARSDSSTTSHQLHTKTQFDDQPDFTSAVSPRTSWHPALRPDAGKVPSWTEAEAPQVSQHETQPKETADAQQSGLAKEQHQVASEGDELQSSTAKANKLEDEELASDSQVAWTEDRQGEAPAIGTAGGRDRPISFARTAVSHDVTWLEEDEPSVEPPQVEIDPTDFLPPASHTNSFPIVPSAAGQRFPMNETEALLEATQEDGMETEAPAASHSLDWEDDNDEPDAPWATQPSDLNAEEDGSLDDRFTEGVPLISHDNPRTDTPVAQHASDPFATDDDGDEDDFFGSRAVEDDTAPVPTLERKSTIQVLDSLAVGNIQTSDTIQEQAADEATPVQELVSNPMASQKPEDLDAKWSAVFGDDDDGELLGDDAGSKEVDPAAFFGSDDEGFLEDTDDAAPAPAPAPAAAPTPAPVQTQTAQPNGRYLPSGLPQQQQPPTPASPYAPVNNFVSLQGTGPAPFQQSHSVSPAAPAYGYGYGAAAPPPTRPEPSKAQSFADKAKGGYTSPYDLPMDVVKPRKRVSMQNLQRNVSTPAAQAPPPRSASLYQGPPRPASGASMSPPTSSHGVPAMAPGQPASSARSQPPTAARAKESFFEDLPIVAKPRPSSRQSNKSVPSPSQSAPPTGLYGPPPGIAPLPTPPQVPYQQGLPQPASGQYQPQPSINSDPSRLVAPQRVNPYAQMPGQGHAPGGPSVPVAAPPSTRYSPAPVSVGSSGQAAPPPTANRYSSAPASQPAPPLAQASPSGYAPAPAQSAPPPGALHAVPPPPTLPFQPRTSSPLAHFERSQQSSHVGGESAYADRRTSSSGYEPRLNRIPSLPQVEEEASPAQTNYSNQVQAQRRGQTPPPSASYSTLSPQKRGVNNYAPGAPGSGTLNAVPPPRPQTQSPSYGHRQPGSNESLARPSSVQGARPTAVPQPSAYAPVSQPAAQVSTAPSARRRTLSQSYNFVPPTDGREHDPLQRWQGSPIFTWGVGGTTISTFPKNVPRYGIGQAQPTMLRSPGEVRVKSVKNILPLEERLAKFPGPLKGKSKKKEVLVWITAGIELLEKSLPDMAFQTQLSLEAKRGVERVLLWKVLRLLVEHDGVLEGSPAVEAAVRGVLSPELVDVVQDNAVGYVGQLSGASLSHSVAGHAQAEAVDPAAVEEIRRHLLIGDREKAVWAAADKRLWGHAMLVANTVSPDLFQKVTQEFVRKEVNSPGHNNESLAALYEVFAGNHDESMDELVPSHARAGLQLMGTTNAAASHSGDAMAGLDKWRETLGLVLSNRSSNDIRALKSLGDLLSSYGRAEAAHICYIFARGQSVFGGLDDPATSFVLLGSDHRTQADQVAKELEPLLLSEVYEYALTLAPTSTLASSSAPHLAAYKLQHALTLAEYGYRDRALAYCETIAAAITSQTKKSPYYNYILDAAVEDLTRRLKLTPREQANGWLARPSVGKMSEGLGGWFNKFVQGDEGEGSGSNSPKNADGTEQGPFGRVSGGTPTISRPASAIGLDILGSPLALGGGGAIAGYAAMAGTGQGNSMPATRAASRYAPMTPQVASPPGTGSYDGSPYAPGRSSLERTSSDLERRSFEMPRQRSDLQLTQQANVANAGKYAPGNGAALASPGYAPQSYQPAQAPTSSPQYPPQQVDAAHPPHQSAPAQGAPSPLYQPPVMQTGSSPYLPSPRIAPVDGAAATPPAPRSYAPTGPTEQPSSMERSSSYQPLAPPPEEPMLNGNSQQSHSQPSDSQPEVETGYQPFGYKFEPPSTSTYEPPSDSNPQPEFHQASQPAGEEQAGSPGGGYEPPSYQPYSYEPPSYNPEPDAEGGGGEDDEKPKKSKMNQFMNDDFDDVPAISGPGSGSAKSAEKTKAEKDRENEEMFRRVAEEEGESHQIPDQDFSLDFRLGIRLGIRY
jgi:COPII coat assembly protein SEC16